MIIKSRDPKEKDIATLEKILKLPSLTEQHRKSTDKELHNLKKGIKGEDDAAYHINFYFGDSSKNCFVIHDLRLEINGRVAQIDHLLINRGLEFFVLETKNYSNKVEINDKGEFTVNSSYNNKGIQSPIQQNERHIDVLKDLIKEHDIMPKRLGIRLKPTYFNYVLFSAESIIKRPPSSKFKTDKVIKVDELKKVILDDEMKKLTPQLADFLFVSKMSSRKTVQEIAEKIASFHTPIQTNYVKKLGIKKEESLPAKKTTASLEQHTNTPEKQQHHCYKCSRPITDGILKFCLDNKTKFNSRVYCMNCQQLFKD